MIKFTPYLQFLPSEITLSNASEFLDNKMNTALAKKLESLIGQVHCPNHPDFENEIEVCISVEKGEIGTVTRSCCKEFHEKLDLVAKNKNPFKKTFSFKTE